MDYAVIENGVIVNIVKDDDGDVANENGWPMLDSLPSGVPGQTPGIGWQLVAGVWDLPTPDPEAQKRQIAMSDATAGIAGLLAQQNAMAAQIQADTALFASMIPGEALTQEHIDAFGRITNGFSTVMQAIIDHLTLNGHISPEVLAGLKRMVPLPKEVED